MGKLPGVCKRQNALSNWLFLMQDSPVMPKENKREFETIVLCIKTEIAAKKLDSMSTLRENLKRKTKFLARSNFDGLLAVSFLTNSDETPFAQVETTTAILIPWLF